METYGRGRERDIVLLSVSDASYQQHEENRCKAKNGLGEHCTELTFLLPPKQRHAALGASAQAADVGPVRVDE